MKQCSIVREEMADLSPVALAFSRLLPSADRDGIFGDLLEDAKYRQLSGNWLALWLCTECSRIAARIGVDRVRAWGVPPVRELVGGLAIDGARTLRHARNGPRAVALSLFLLTASATLLALSVDFLVSSVLSASGFHRAPTAHVGSPGRSAHWPLP